MKTQTTRKISLFFLIIFSSWASIYSQLDNEFWFVVPAISILHSAEGSCNCDATLHNNGACGGSPASLNISNFDNVETVVTIEMPANKYDILLNPTGFVTIVDTIPARTTRRIQLWDNNVCNAATNGIMRKLVENRIHPTSPQQVLKHGLHITATNYVTVYYEVEEVNNTDVFALKGSNAIGSDFFCPFQRNKGNHNLTGVAAREIEDARSAIDIVAVDPGITVVEVYPTDSIIGWGNAPFTVTLLQGESISLNPGYVSGTGVYVWSQAANRRLEGTRLHVQGGKRIAVTLSDDSVDGDSGCYDLVGDQTIPVEAIADDGSKKPLIGQEYIVMKGDLGSLRAAVPEDYDRIYILATQNNTNVIVTDITNNITYNYNNIAAGQQRTHRINAVGVGLQNITRVFSDDPTKPIYVFHVTGGGGGCEIGGAVLPTVSQCTGSFEVGFSRGATPASAAIPNWGGYAKQFLLNVMVREENDDDSARFAFTLYDDGVAVPISGNLFTKVTGSKFWAAQIPFYNCQPFSSNILKNTKNIFHLGTLNGGSANGGNYGYFSDYASVSARSIVSGTNDPGAKVCFGNQIQLIAYGGVKYEWIDELGGGKYLDDRFAQRPFCLPREDVKYRVIVSGASCEAPDTSEVTVLVSDSLVTNFELDAYDICAPDSVVFANLSYNSQKNYWYFDANPIATITNTNSSLIRHYTNPTDTPQVHSVKLVAINRFCNIPLTRYFTVYPELNADFIADDTAGCHPFTVNVQNTSTGSLDTTRFYWSFGDNNFSYDVNPTHLYKNFDTVAHNHTLKLVATSPYVCKDSTEINLTVYPYINTQFSADSTISCNPIDIILNPQGSIGVDTFNWSFFDENRVIIDSAYSSQTSTPLNFYHYDNTQPNPDSIYVQLIGTNDYGCFDSAITRQLIIFPEIVADFSLTPDVFCDSNQVTFTNNSIGFNPQYIWDFGDGKSTNTANPVNRYYNRSINDTTYIIRLLASSGFICTSEHFDSVTVHPYIKADFGMDFENNCSPLNITFTNTSISSPHNFWDFATGVPQEDNNGTILRSFVNPFPNNDTTYTIELVAINNFSCSDTLRRSVLLFPKVVAGFNLVKNSNCPPLDVNFTNTSQGGNLTYTWEFGDNTSSANPAVNFTKEYNNDTPSDIVYPIKLTARNQVGCDSSWNDTITVFARIQADFSLDDYESCPPFTIQASEDCSEGTNIFNWTFGDGNTSTSTNPSNTYFNNTLLNDTLLVRLIALGLNDIAHQLCADTADRTIVVFPNLVADFNFTGDSVGCQPLNTGIQNNSNLLAGSEFRWFIDNEFYANAETPPAITLANSQSIDVTKSINLYGRTANGCLDTTSHALTAYSLVDAYFTSSRDTLCSGDSVFIDRQNSQGGITNYYWSFEGEAPVNYPNALFYRSFENLIGGVPVDNSIMLVAENNHNCTDTLQRRITIAPQVYAEFNFDNNTVCYPYMSQFTNTTQYANSYLWDFGDNINSTEINPAHQYNNFDKINDLIFTTKLIAKSRYNCYDSINHPITIKAKPAADFYFPVAANCPPFEAQMVNNSVGSGLSYFWDFDSEGTSSEAAPNHTFSNESNNIDERLITLIVTSGVNCKDTMEKSLSVFPNVHVDFAMSDDAGCSPLNINLTGDTNQTVVQMLWFIDNKAFSTIKDPSYRFVNETTNNKIHDVRFVARSLYDCADTMDRQVTVYPTPIGEFIPSPLPAEYGTEEDQTPITFSNETVNQNNWSYLWSYGDGNTNSEDAATFTYDYGALFWGSGANNYYIPVQMIAWNTNNTECSDTVNHDIIIYPPQPQIDLAEDLAACEPFLVDFTAWTKYIYEDSLLWEFGDGETSTELEPVHVYSEPGVYTAKLIVRGEGGTNWDYKIITVNPKPLVDFTFTDSLVFVSSQTKGYEWINFFNLSRYAKSYRWYFDAENIGGNPDSDSTNPSWYYDKMGTYYVALIAESGEGCSDTLIHPIPIQVLGEGRLRFPTAFFVSPDGPGQEDDTDDLTNKYVFYPDNEGVDEYRLEIYNRWGVLVFESDNVEIGWNGYIQGTPAKQDVYVWRARGRFTNGQPYDMAGDVTLIRGTDDPKEQ